MTFKLFSRLTGDHQTLAETYIREGNKSKAAEEYAKAGDFHRAADLAAEIQDEPRMIRYSLLAALGRIPAGRGDLSASQAGDLLVKSGNFEAAIPLFELAGDLRRAAAAALKLGDNARAGRYYEKAKMWAEAGACFEQGGLFPDALRMLETESRSLSRGRSEPTARVQEVNLKRAELLLQLGRGSAAVALLKQLPASVRRAELFERSGNYTEAIEAYLGAGDSGRALTLAKRSPDQGRRVAAIHLRAGRAIQAGQLFADLGLMREAAEAYETGRDWWRAAYGWEIAQEPGRAAEAYRQAGKLQDAARCSLAAGLPQQAADLYLEAGAPKAAAGVHVQTGDFLAAVALYLKADDLEAAVATLRRLPTVGADYPVGALLVAPKLIEQGRPEEALQLLGRAPAPRDRQPSSQDHLYWEGRALEALGQPVAARERYTRVLELGPARRDAAERLDRLQPPARSAPATMAPSVTTPAMLTPGATTPVAGLASGMGAPAVGQRLANRYEILDELGHGGMGRVYKARDLDLDELVAIKTLLTPAEGATRDSEERLLRELQICRRVTHPNVVRVFDLGRFDGGIFITMELLEGQILEQLILWEESLPLARIRFFLAEIAAGLQEAHALGIVHRDLKPSNVMVMERHLKILDFGIARMTGFDSRLTQTGLAFGSPMYMSPEQLQGLPLDGRSDLYALGILAYTLIAGREPFQDGNLAVLALQHLRDEVPDIRQFRPGLPDPWLELLAKLLAKDPASRYDSAGQLLAVLAALPVEEPPPA
jgi:tetratricopeptide (TPR) repeat protein